MTLTGLLGRVIVGQAYLDPISALGITFSVESSIFERFDQRAGGAAYADSLPVV
jgi:hypothetical protein